MNQPAIGEVLFTHRLQLLRTAVKVVRLEGTTVFYVPAWCPVIGVHQGTLYDSHGDPKYMV